MAETRSTQRLPIAFKSGEAPGGAVRAWHEPSEAVFAANDPIAIGLFHGLSARGLRVPDDVAIVGYDDIGFAATASVPQSSIRRPRAELGRRGAELLFEEIAARESGTLVEHQHFRFQPELLVRLSSASRPRERPSARPSALIHSATGGKPLP